MRDSMTKNEKGMRIEKPLIIVFEQNGQITTHLYPDKYSYDAYGLIITDVVRHIADMFDVHENKVWEWVDKERNKPTTQLNSYITTIDKFLKGDNHDS